MTNPLELAGPPSFGADPEQLAELVSYQLKRAFLASHAAYAAVLAKIDLAPGHFAILAVIAERPDLLQKDVAIAIGLDQSTVVPLVKALEGRGWIKRREGEDRRARRLSLTVQGERAIANLMPLILNHEARVTANLSDKDRGQLLKLLRRVRTAF